MLSIAFLLHGKKRKGDVLSITTAEKIQPNPTALTKNVKIILSVVSGELWMPGTSCGEWKMRWLSQYAIIWLAQRDIGERVRSFPQGWG